MKKVLMLCMAVIMALGALGVGYAMWSDTVTIQTTVQTGSVDVDLVAQKSNDPGPWVAPYVVGPGNGDPSNGHQPLGNGYWGGLFTNNSPVNDPAGWYWSGSAYEKNVAWTDCNFTEDTLTITVNNGYPSYGPDVAWAVQNNGTIPVKILSIRLVSVTTPTAGTVLMDVPVDSNYNTTTYLIGNDASVTPYNGPYTAGFDDAYAFSLVLTAVGGQPLLYEQIEPGMGLWGDVGLHVAQAAIQSSQYAFTLKYKYAQWNEVP